MSKDSGVKISVIVPCYNSEKTLSTCLESITLSAYNNYEIIVVDDASTDSSPEIAKKYPVKLIELNKNLGAGSARNRGAEIATGDLLFFVDSDVYLYPNALKSADAFFKEKTQFSALVGSYTEFTAWNDPYTSYQNFLTFYHHNLSGDDIEWFWGALGIVRINIYKELGGLQEHYSGANVEDLEFGYRLNESGYKIAYSREVCGEHARQFNFRSMIYNGYRKAVIGAKLYITRKQLGIGKHGFSNLRNGLSLSLIYLFWIGLIIWLFGGGCRLVILSFFIFTLINIPFYHFIYKKTRFSRIFNMFWLHFVQFNAIATGVIMGLVGLMLGKGLESSSKWF